AAKQQHDLLPAEMMVDMAQLAPPALAARAARLASRLRLADRINSPVNLVISNVPGPREPLYFGGAEMLHFYPISIVTDGQGLNITVQSYCDQLDVGLIACRDLVPDLEFLMDCLADETVALLELLGLADTPAPAPTPAPTPTPAKKATKKRAAAKVTSS
ncbi:MAG: WSD1 family O-acyltransferase, partial [Acidimicrobiales bacterium]